MLDLRPYGTFIEYTIRPLVDDVFELVGKLDKYNIDYASVVKRLVKLYVIEKVLSTISQVICTSLICLTIYLCYFHR